MKSTPESSQEFLHFGNMGGLLPTLAATDLKDAESPGAKLVYRFCGQCHSVPGPGMHTHEEWNQVFWRMIWRMQVMRAQFKDFHVPTYGESQVMFSYVTGHALQAINTGDVAPDAEGAKEFLKICMQCHRLPDPAQHEARDWREVVVRMKSHMKNMSRTIPGQEETDRIVSFLKARAAKKE
ncbi:MAG: hypothetical protein HQL91_06860 [Magnetococcales bacterium]|nr:hypothetical protein [Magnetococcales bacterium]